MNPEENQKFYMVIYHDRKDSLVLSDGANWHDSK